MDTERTAPPGPRRRRGGRSRAGWERIPLPALPERRPASAGLRDRGQERELSPSTELSREEADLLMGDLPPAGNPLAVEETHRPGPDHVPSQDGAKRTGAPGAVVLNDLVEEIERDLERELARYAQVGALPAYRRTACCSLPADSGRRAAGQTRPDDSGRR